MLKFQLQYVKTDVTFVRSALPHLASRFDAPVNVEAKIYTQKVEVFVSKKKNRNRM